MVIFIVPKNSGLERCKEIIKKYDFYGKIIEVRGEDVPLVVSEIAKTGDEAVGITGEDLFAEFKLKDKDSKLEVIEKINWDDKEFIFRKPTLCLLGPKEKKFEDLSKKIKICINSKYKNIAEGFCKSYFEEKGYFLEKIYAKGATEEFFSAGVADLIIDIVCSGKSAEEAGLRVYEKIFASDIVVIMMKDSEEDFIEKLDFEKGFGLIPTIVKDEQGNIQEIVRTKTDCDRDSLLFIVRQKGRGYSCCLGRYSCFKEEKKFDLQELYNKISSRINSNDTSSYTKQIIENDKLDLFRDRNDLISLLDPFDVSRNQRTIVLSKRFPRNIERKVKFN